MAQIDDDRLVTLNFKKGVDNRSRETKVGIGAARHADNVDIDEDGVVASRSGYELFATLPGAHSLWTHEPFNPVYAFVGDATSLYRVDSDGSLTTLVTGLTGNEIYYAAIGNRCFWSNGYNSGIIKLSNWTLPLGLQMLPWGVETPLFSQYQVSVSTTGGLDAGMYGVTVTFSNAQGEEGGAPEPVWVNVPQGGGITITPVPSPIDAGPTLANFYRTGCNSPDFLFAQTTAQGASSITLGAQLLGKQLVTMKCLPFPAARFLHTKQGRIFGAMDRMLVWTDPLYYGIYHPSNNYMSFPDPITMIASPEGDGFTLYVGTTKNVFMLHGDSVEKCRQVKTSFKGVVPGSMAMIPPEVVNLDGVVKPVPFWIGADGVPWVGTEGGLEQLSEIFAYPAYSKANAGFIASDGYNRYIVSGQGARPSDLAVTDTVVATVYNNGGGP
jgi:hypothetical protein